MTQPKQFYSVINAQIPEIHIYGYIGDDEDGIDYKGFQDAFRKLVSSNKKIIIRGNSGGGSMIEGFAIVDLIQNSDCEVEYINEGMAGSMAGVIMQACDRRGITTNGLIMTHQASGIYYGGVDGMRSYADMMEGLQNRAIDLYKSKSKQSDEVVKTWFMAGKEKYFTAKEALALGLCDRIIESSKSISKLPNVKNKSPKDLWAVYNQIKIENSNKNIISMKKVFMVLSAYKVPHTLTDESTEQQVADVVENALKAKDDKIKELQVKLDAQNASRINSLVENAITDGKIAKEQKDSFTKMAEVDFESAEKFITEMKAKPVAQTVDINKFLDKGKEAGKEKVENRDTWNYHDWETKDSKGLLEMKKTEPEKFNALLNAYTNPVV